MSQLHSNLSSRHYLKMNERIDYKLLCLAYKVLATTQPPYHNLISLQNLLAVLALPLSSLVLVLQPAPR